MKLEKRENKIQKSRKKKKLFKTFSSLIRKFGGEKVILLTKII